MSDADASSEKSPPARVIDPRSIRVPTGLRDLYPADLNRLRFIQDAWRRTSINFGFEEIDGPTFEDSDLYAVKSGEGILNEVFGVFSGKDPKERERLAAGGGAPFALRPEFTPTLARMYAAKAGALPKPTKWFWTQNCFRAERPQRGRLREFYQWNCDIIGLESADPMAEARADAECIATCVGLLEGLGLTPRDVRVKISHRSVIADLIRQSASNLKSLDGALLALDRRDKEPADRFAAMCAESGFDLAKFNAAAAQIGLPEQLAEAIESMKLSDWIDFDTTIVRGLAYYTGMVFEVHEATGAERAIAGGGRYDGLIELFGGLPTPAVGFGMGDVVLSLVLQDRGLMPTDAQIADRLGQRPDVFVISNGTPEADAQVGSMLAALRRSTPKEPGLHARRSYKATKNVGKLLQDAAKSGSRWALIIETATSGQLKNLDTQAQSAIDLSAVPDRVRRSGGASSAFGP